MKPLGLSMWKLTSPAPMRDAGGRLFVDVTEGLASPTARPGLLEALGRSDPLISDALEIVLDRADIALPVQEGVPVGPPWRDPPPPIEADPAIVTELIERTRASITEAKRGIESLTGEALFDFILADMHEMRRMLFDPRSHQVIMAGLDATWWLNEHMEEWLGEKNAADVLTGSVAHNVTSAMGLALLDVADVIRPHPEVVSFLQTVGNDDSFLDRPPEIKGAPDAFAAIRTYLATYGMRCPGEIDITRPRWSERPTMLVPLLLAHIKNFEAGEAERRIERGRREAIEAEIDLLVRLRTLPRGEIKAQETAKMIDRVRTFIGYREYPKYGMVTRYFVYKQALLGEAERLVSKGVLVDREDIFFLTFQEAHEVVRTGVVDAGLLARRKAEFASFQSLTPPRVLTSAGETIVGSYRRGHLPSNVLVGLGVSSGVVEGRARIISDAVEAALEPGDILVTAATDPGWTPLLVVGGGLVTEVGGLMTHGAVIAREYGLPAVIGVMHATRLIKDGQRIRVNGTDGTVEILPGD